MNRITKIERSARGSRKTAWLSRLCRSTTQRVMSLTFMGMLLSLCTDILLAARFGATRTTDILIVALSIPLLADTVTREGSKFSLVPVFVEKLIKDPEDFPRFSSGILHLAVVIGGIFWGIGTLVAPWVISGISPGLSPDAHTESVKLFHACAPILAFAPAITVQNVILNSSRKFGLAALRNSVAPLTVILTIWLTWHIDDAVVWIAGAYALGFAVYFAVLAIGLRYSGIPHIWNSWVRREDMRTLRRAVSWPTLGFGVRQTVWIVERAIASFIAIGGISSYYFAFRIYSGIQTVIGTSIATTSLPDLSATKVAGTEARLSSQLLGRVMRGLALGLPIAIVILLFSNQIIGSFYGWGRFDQTAIGRTGSLLQIFGIGIVFTCVVPILNAALYAIGATRTVFLNLLIMSALRIATAWLLAMVLGLGLKGIATAVTLTAVASSVCLQFLLRRHNISLWRRN